ncbi:MAG: hypothetical protein JXA30_10960 [Deltaproteobacteria bacterium]|nr:hypothetical protein [Deltaproteobacteria bacterium]
MFFAKKPRTTLLTALVFLLTACDSSEQKKSDSKKQSPEGETAPATASTSMVEFFALPVSLRSGGRNPSECHKIELTPTSMRFSGNQTLAISGGKVADSEQDGDQILKLKSAWQAAPRSCLAVEAHSNLSYQAVVQVLNTAQAVGIKSLSFRVRKPNSTETGWLTLDDYRVVPYADDVVTIDTVQARSWGEFTNVWDSVYQGCARSSGGFCKEKPLKIAEGGELQIVFFALGDAINVEFRRVGAPDPNQEKAAEEAGRKSKKKRAKSEKELLEENPLFAEMTPEQIEEYRNMPFATEAVYQFRGQEALVSPSSVSATVAPICGKSRCGVLMTGQRRTITIRFLSLIGAAFPDGVPEPTIWFMLPNI